MALRAEGRLEPFLTIQVLPRCKVCEKPHPLASNSPSLVCLFCGTPTSELPPVQEVTF